MLGNASCVKATCKPCGAAIWSSDLDDLSLHPLQVGMWKAGKPQRHNTILFTKKKKKKKKLIN